MPQLPTHPKLWLAQICQIFLAFQNAAQATIVGFDAADVLSSFFTLVLSPN